MKDYLDSAALKSAARVHLFGSYGVTVRAYIWMNSILFIMTWLFASMSNSGAGSFISVFIFFVIRLLITGIFMSGVAYLYLNIISKRPVYAGMVFYGFRHQTDKAAIVCIVQNIAELTFCIPMLVFYMIFQAAANPLTIILLIGGCLVGLAGSVLVRVFFMPAYFLIHDFPDYAVLDIIKLCPEVMKNHFGRAVLLYISFIPLFLLEIVSLGAAAPWVSSYLNATMAAMYIDIMRKG